MVLDTSAAQTAFLSAASSLSAERKGRAVPSPSSVAKCFRQLWYKGTDAEPTEPPDGESYVSAETGRLTEGLMAGILERSGLVKRMIYQTEEERELEPWELERMGFAGGQHDHLAESHDGDLILVEFKRKPAFKIKDLAKRGLQVVEPVEYYQVQSLLHAKRLERAIYIAVFASRQEVTQAMEGDIRFAVHIEEVEYKKGAALAMKDRAAKATMYINNVTDGALVPRSSVEGGLDPRARKFPCGTVNRAKVFTPWCPYYRRCLEDTERESNG